MSGVSTLDELKNWSFDYLINVEGHTQSLITADDEVPLYRRSVRCHCGGHRRW